MPISLKPLNCFQADSVQRVRKSNRHLIRSSLVSRTGLSLDDDLDVNPLEIDVNNIYTPWTRWSRCKKKCKQVRKRYCTFSAICGSNVLKVKFGRNFMLSDVAPTKTRDPWFISSHRQDFSNKSSIPVLCWLVKTKILRKSGRE